MDYYKNYIILPALLLITAIRSHAQQAIPAGQPEQDACGALALCGGYFFTPYAYQGYGTMQEQSKYEPSPGFGETNSVWLKLTVATAGNIVFTITPVSSADDYDFSIFNGTNHPCTPLDLANRVRTNGNTVQGSNGQSGLDYTSTETVVQSGTVGFGFLQYIAANAGDVYYIMINNFSGSPSGFGIDFQGSTATFNTIPAPSYEQIVSGCIIDPSRLTVQLDQPVLCNSIAPDGSDFEITPALATITSASGFTCMGAGGYTRQIVLTFSNALPEGSYTLQSRTGTDGNSLLNVCSEAQLIADHQIFVISAPLTVNVGPDTAGCTGGTLGIAAHVSGGYQNRLTWTPALNLDHAGISHPVATLQKDITYILSVIPNGKPACEKKDTINIKVLQGFHIETKDTTICAGNSIALQATGDPRYIYAWLPAVGGQAASTFSMSVSPSGSTIYTLTASYPGCPDSVQSVNIAVASPPDIFLGNDTILCYNDWLTMEPIVSPAGDYHYLWAPDSLFNNPAILQPAYHATTTNRVILTIITGDGCISTMSRKFSLSPGVNVEAGADQVVAVGKAIVLSASVSDPDAGLQWIPSTYLSNDTILQPSLTPLTDQLYYLTATNQDHCITYDSVLIKTYKEIQVPNAFSPNGDGIHDNWSIPNLIDYNRCSVEIFNRYGQQVYRSTGYYRPWDGRMNGSPLAFGVYYYIIRLNDGRSHPLSGSVTILR